MKLILFILCITFSLQSSSQPNITLEAFGTTFNSPVSIKHAGDSKLFVVELSGYIQILNANGTVNSSPFLDINTIVTNAGGESGLLGLAFHPDYTTNGVFYVNYINNSGDTVISRYTRTNETTANAASEVILLTINQTDTNHNGGELNFGTDGYLYIAMGDGGGSGDPFNAAQNLNSLLGKLLRIDVDNTSNGNNYAIPANNPFLNDGNANTLPEIWAYGLRNPWKFSFDKSTDDLWIADVGQGDYEEINMVSPTIAELNYGWRCYEGINHTYNTSGCVPESSTTRPIAEYSHSGSGAFKCSITGGFRYRGSNFSNFNGLYFFADYCSNEIGYLKQNGATWSMTFTTTTSGGNWSTFGEDVNGELYIAALSNGQIYKIVDSNLSTNDFEKEEVFKMYPNPVENELTISLNNSGFTLKNIHIYNLQGQLIKEINTIENNSIKVPTQTLSKGLYLVQVTETSGSKSSKKLIIL